MRRNLSLYCLMISLLCVVQANAQVSRRGGIRFSGGIVLLAADGAVQKELGISDDDKKKIDKIVDDLNIAVKESTGEQHSNVRENGQARKMVTEKLLPKLKEVISLDQFKRLEEINVQLMGTAAYEDATIIKTLSISDAQRQKFRSIRSDIDAKRREMVTSGVFGRAAFEKMKDLDKDFESKFKEVLTKEQLKKFAAMKGKEFDVTQTGFKVAVRSAPKGKRPQRKEE